ncbi:hypothetical protein QRB41_12950 [Mycobacterium avium subsp. hominissuis]|uniref:hypothetical protein n=1 Tax=Mycobacteriaceae TaxID=1762 RepID=UPI000FA72695|nr:MULTISPECIES: hypothetical protein [Mycobacteriaceae]MDO2384306.1 hypothetical protein [Mycobacterium avium subsp. hominissuis]MDO2395322.1 hypothetical protein [Mycobacterium avium subsp. hominissuis]RUP26125.1 MAG: hypothetical protein EKK51_30860 [Mycolicibacterium sp.]
MSRGLGVRQREVLSVLVERSCHDSYSWSDLSEVFVRQAGDGDELVEPFRWYTIELLGLADAETPRSDRVSLHRAIKGLASRGFLEVSTSFPHADRLVSTGTTPGLDRFSWGDLALFNKRFPLFPDRCLWFRNQVPPGWRTATEHYLDSIEVPYESGGRSLFDDFLAFPDREHVWKLPLGRFIIWLIGGTP